jgi:hypothetical protein
MIDDISRSLSDGSGILFVLNENSLNLSVLNYEKSRFLYPSVFDPPSMKNNPTFGFVMFSGIEMHK